MLHINDADQTAMPADDNKKQEQDGLEPLPWELGKGFLWGYPATVWLILRHPVKAFSLPTGGQILRNELFLLINCLLSTAFSIFIKLIFTSAYNQTANYTNFINGLYTLFNDYLITHGSYMLGSVCWAGIANTILVIFGHNISYYRLLRVSLLSSVAVFVLLIPYIGYQLSIFLFGLFLPFIGMRYALKVPSLIALATALVSFCMLVVLATLALRKF